MSDLITVERRDDDDRRPSFAIKRVGTDVGVRFAGVPMGHEFTSFVLALLQVGGHPPRVDEQTVRGSGTCPVGSTSRPTSRCPVRTARTSSRPST
jgi:hypothetical protein